MTNALRAYRLLLRWQYYRFRRELPIIVLIQLALALGMIYGFTFLMPEIDRRSALYLATGAPTMTLLLLGLNVVPQEVSQGKLTGRFDYLRSLPIPRLAPMAADVSFWLIAALPGTVLALLLGSLRFGFALRVSWMIVPTVLLIAFSGSCVGYAMAMALRPQVANQISQFVAIGILLFSPLSFPAERLPDVLAKVHQVLPIQYMADLVRWSLTGSFADRPTVAFAVVAAWCAAGLAVSYRLATRRR